MIDQQRVLSEELPQMTELALKIRNNILKSAHNFHVGTLAVSDLNSVVQD